MSKKRLILASAVLSAAVLTASCGGGGGGGGAPAQQPPPPPPSPSPSPRVIGYALVQALKGITSPGAITGYYLAEVRDNGTASFTEIRAPFDAKLDYMHQYSNGNILLYDVNTGDAYIYTRGIPGTIAPIGCRIPSISNSIYLPNFVIVEHGDPLRGIPQNVEYVITQNGKCIEVSTPTLRDKVLYAGRDYVLISDGGAPVVTVTVIKKDGTSETIKFTGDVHVYDRVDGTDTIVLSAYHSTEGQPIYVIRDDGSVVKITNDANVATGDDSMRNLTPGAVRIARDSAGNLYVAAFDSINDKLQYFKILPAAAGSVVYTPTKAIEKVDTIVASFVMDGNGALYTIQNCDGDRLFELGQHFINDSNIYTTKCVNTAANDDFDNHVMLSFANGVLISDPTHKNFYHYIFNAAQPTNVALQQSVIDAVAFCNQVHALDAFRNFQSHTEPLYTATLTERIQGLGTNTITCADYGNKNVFAWVQVTGPGTYNGATVDPDGTEKAVSNYFVAATGNKMIFVDKIDILNRVYPATVYVCSAGATTCTTASLSKTPFLDVYNPMYSIRDLRPIVSNVKIKSDNNVISDGALFRYGGALLGAAPSIRATYFTNIISSPYIVDMLAGSVDTTTLDISFTDFSARGGNVNLAMNIVSNVRSPVAGASCPRGLFDHLWFKTSTLSFNNLGRPTNTCLVNVLGTFSP